MHINLDTEKTLVPLVYTQMLQMLLHTHTQGKLLHTETFHAKGSFHAPFFPNKTFWAQKYTQNLLHTGALKHTDIFTHRRWDTQALTQRASTHSLLVHTNAEETLEHRTPVYTQNVLHKGGSTQRSFCTQKLLQMF